MRHFSLSAIGRDRPGIVAALTQALLAHDLNIEDSQMTILRGRFTVMLIVGGPDAIDAGALRADLEATASHLGMDAISLDDVAGPSPHDAVVPTHVVTVYGVDHPGIVNAVAAALAHASVNITDLNTRLVADGDSDLYAMMLEVVLPQGLGADEVTSLLEAARREQNVEVTVRELEQDEL